MDKVVDIIHRLPLDGLALKYEKALSNRRVPDKAVLGVHTYNIEGTKVYVICTKQLFGQGKRAMGELLFSYYLETICPYTGKRRYIRPSFDYYGLRVISYMEFTSHFVKRLKERAGLDFIDIVTMQGAVPIIGDIADKDGETIMKWGDYTLFGYRGELVTYITTMVTPEMLRQEQIEKGIEFDDVLKDFIDKRNIAIRA